MIVAVVKTPLLVVSGSVVAVVDTVVVAWRTAGRRIPIVRPHSPPRCSRLDRDVAVAGLVLVLVAEGDPVRPRLPRLFWEEEVVAAAAARPPHVGSSGQHRTRRRIVMTTTMMAVVAAEEEE